MTTTSLPVSRISVPLWPFSRRYWRYVLFLLTSFLLGTAWFSLLMLIVSLAGSLLVIGIGVPLLFVALFMSRSASHLERRRFALLLHHPIDAQYQHIADAGRWHRFIAIASDPAVWQDVAYLLILFLLGLIDILVLGLTLVVPLALICLFVFSLCLPSFPVFASLAFAIKVPALLLLGVLWLWAGQYVLFLMVHLHLICADQLLAPSLRGRLAVLTKSRTDVLEAALGERQRIAQDLHDGVQQQLIALAIDLGLAKEKLATEPETVQALIVQSHQHAKQVLVEVRDLARGIYPAILTDRGLDAALSALARRSPVPITITVHLQRRFSDLMEATLYFVCAEALANSAKHSGASAVSVLLLHEHDTLLIEVTDNGRGGAVIIPGAGLAGLQNRLTALDGTLTLSSPVGGPTCVRGVVPCVS